MPLLLLIDLLMSSCPLEWSVSAPADVLIVTVEPHTRETYDANAILVIWGQIILLAVFTIWARTVGPRFRPDQLSDLTWKDLLLLLLGMLVTVILLIQ